MLGFPFILRIRSILLQLIREQIKNGTRNLRFSYCRSIRCPHITQFLGLTGLVGVTEARPEDVARLKTLQWKQIVKNSTHPSGLKKNAFHPLQAQIICTSDSGGVVVKTQCFSVCCVTRSGPRSASPDDLLPSCSTESWSHCFLCGLIRLIRSCASFQGPVERSGPEASGGDRGCLSGLISSFTQQHRMQAKADQVGIPPGHVSSLPTPHTPRPAGPLASFPSIIIYTWQPGSKHDVKRI